MKQFLVFLALTFSLSAFATEVAKAPTECVTKDKKGNCPAAPKSPKPTPKKKIEEKK
jgi:hypothetical protein